MSTSVPESFCQRSWKKTHFCGNVFFQTLLPKLFCWFVCNLSVCVCKRTRFFFLKGLPVSVFFFLFAERQRKKSSDCLENQLILSPFLLSIFFETETVDFELFCHFFFFFFAHKPCFSRFQCIALSLLRYFLQE